MKHDVTTGVSETALGVTGMDLRDRARKHAAKWFDTPQDVERCVGAISDFVLRQPGFRTEPLRRTCICCDGSGYYDKTRPPVPCPFCNSVEWSKAFVEAVVGPIPSGEVAG